MDGELFKSELVLRFYLSMKTHAVHSLSAAFASSSDVYASVLSSYSHWARAVSDEEMTAIRSLEGVDDLWLQVVTTYVRQSYRSSDAKAVSVRIKTPELEEFARSFYKWIVRAQGCANGTLWTGDAIRIDFVTREAFRCALMDSIHILRVEKEDPQDEIGPDDSVSRFCDDDDATTVVTVREKKRSIGSGPSVVQSAVSRSSKASRFTAARLRTIAPIREESESPPPRESSRKDARDEERSSPARKDSARDDSREEPPRKDSTRDDARARDDSREERRSSARDDERDERRSPARDDSRDERSNRTPPRRPSKHTDRRDRSRTPPREDDAGIEVTLTN